MIYFDFILHLHLHLYLYLHLLNYFVIICFYLYLYHLIFYTNYFHSMNADYVQLSDVNMNYEILLLLEELLA